MIGGYKPSFYSVFLEGERVLSREQKGERA